MREPEATRVRQVFTFASNAPTGHTPLVLARKGAQDGVDVAGSFVKFVYLLGAHK